MFKTIGIAACAMAALLAADETFSPARYRTGAKPPLPALVVGGGEVFLEVAVDRGGRVAGVTPLRGTPPFTDLVANAVRGWRFQPAQEAATDDGLRGPVESTVLVAALFRPPAIHGPTPGELSSDLASPSPQTPMPLARSLPPFPPLAAGSGVVLVEARVDATGSVSEVRVVGPAPPFDEAARAAAERWSFRPARVHGRAVPTVVYLMFGFPMPVVTPTRAFP